MEKEICVLKNFRNILDATTDTDCTDLDNAIKTIEYAMKPKTCEGCKTLPFVLTELAKKNGGKCGTCKRYVKDNYEAELKAKENDLERQDMIIKCLSMDLDSKEKQLKAKDKRIAELEKNNTNLINDVIVLDNDLHRFLSIERKKARSIVAMLFWDMKKYDKYSKVNNVQDYVNNKNKFYALEPVFKKAYVMLKAT